ncbi:MAG: hypothetical protein CMH61_00115 [Nanoarchaeota archaeon]|nr:hypothetical protein [Nanoarchaeota archaeon]
MKKLVILIFLLVVPTVLAQGNHMTLLAVQELDGVLKGSEADLFVELNEGESRVFLETYPLTRMDTQISTRFAKDIACSFFDLDCSENDFIYTIRADSNIIGGPSAGAAIAALTAITVLDLNYEEDITITGTINSGGVIGPVGGVKEKIEAAAENSIRTVLIAQGTMITNETNLQTYGESLGITVKEVADLNDVLFHMTGKTLKQTKQIPDNPQYESIMQNLQNDLCVRTIELHQTVNEFNVSDEEREEIQRQLNQSDSAVDEQNYYAAASFCFGTNVYLKGLWYEKKNLTESEQKEKIDSVKKNVQVIEQNVLSEPIQTIADLQTSIIVAERLDDVRNQLETFNESENVAQSLAYTEERLFSALSWMTFFTMPGKEFVLNDEILERSCRRKIQESEERFQYVTLVLGGLLERQDTREKIDDAKASLETDRFNLCLIQASEAKADSNLILSSISVPRENIDQFVQTKLDATKRVIAENSEEGIFPIIGFSYLNYADALQESEPMSSLLFAEYALELSDMDIYFTAPRTKVSFKKPSPFGEGFAMGVILTVLVVLILHKTRGKNHKDL